MVLAYAQQRDHAKRVKEKKIKVSIAGGNNSGKDTTGQLLEKMFMERFSIAIRCISVGTHVIYPLAKELGLPFDSLGKPIIDDPEFDMKVDRRVLEMLEKDENIIVTSRMIPALLSTPEFYDCSSRDSVIRLFFDCTDGEKARREVRRVIYKTHKRLPTEEEYGELSAQMLKDTVARDERDLARYTSPQLYGRYGIKEIFDPKYFHETIPTTGMSREEQAEATMTAILHHIH